MSPLFVQAEGRERNAPADRRAELRVIVLFTEDLIFSEGSTTSSYFDRWCEIHTRAEALLGLCEQPSFAPFDRLIAGWVREIIAELESYLPVEEGGSS